MNAFIESFIGIEKFKDSLLSMLPTLLDPSN